MVVSVVVVRLWEALMWEGMKQRQGERKGGGVGVGGERVGVMQPWREPKLDVGFRHISPDAAGIQKSSLVLYLSTG